ncbi:MAG: aminomethyl-transferring glycine dehydrogenase subunit GcvPB [Candidatus Calescibacterium sp.]|nr:aminomethyl-transferring glycine dehydrogenase subunit GcvPB [Candidatus Calescibacterium sp.]MCX7971857.1 aminomethyl-transferring glycine dehydrogenase subunit GcvPB [bacterium]MDW8195044.1 aminomethyl-transferring glycine dehydrogenase subunit GcvPB [Candidatus Calescibacterium sp.]
MSNYISFSKIDDCGLERKNIDLPEFSELEVVRYFTNLSRKNWGVDVGFYPLGSCTMKYNPKVNDFIAEKFRDFHPFLDDNQPILELLKELENKIAYLVGLDRVSLLPAAGAHGEYTALLIAKKYFSTKNESRDTVLVPDSAHGTNPASASMAGFKVITIKSNSQGQIDIEDLKNKINSNVAVFMITNPNTLGIYEKKIEEIIQICKEYGALTYYDGANFNAIIGKLRPGDMGFDMVHLNLHKTFSTPHGSGGPGAGPIAVRNFLAKFLPIPLISYDGNRYYLNFDLPETIGMIRDFWGNFGVLIRALAYTLSYGKEISKVSEFAVLNANYLRKLIKEYFIDPYDQDFCAHEFVLSASNYKEKGIRAMDIAKRMLDYNIHPPTVYFPLIVEEALMIEPTETEDINTLDYFAEVVRSILRESEVNPSLLKEAPFNTPVGRINEAFASREPKPTRKSLTQ